MFFDTLQTLGAFVLTLAILITVHEYGHFWVARRCGVKVLRFSVGFGKRIFSWYDKKGTEFSLALIPLGGFVKMLDEREGAVADNEKHLSFNSQPVLSRIAIVAAGPIANFLLAIVVLALMYFMGVRSVIPQVGQVLPDSAAAVAGIQSGDQILAVDGQPTQGWRAVNLELLSYVGETRSISLTVQSGEPGQVAHGAISEKQLKVTQWLVNDETANPVQALGIIPFTPTIPAVIGEIVEGGAADKAGIKAGDQILASNDVLVTDWMQWVDSVRGHPDTVMNVELLRNNQAVFIELRPTAKDVDGQQVGHIGAAVKPFDWPEGMIQTLEFSPLNALMKGVEATWSLVTMTVVSLQKMLVGLISVKNLSGPITIATVASASLQSGMESFLYFLGMLSVSLGVLNLLPVPVLDGGHLLFYLVEWVRGKPLSDKVQLVGWKVGVTLVMCVMMLAFYNDLSRLF